MISILDLLLLVIVPNKINNITFADFIDNDDDDTKEFGLAIDNFAKINLATQRCQDHFDKISSQSNDLDARKILDQLKFNLDEKTEFANTALAELETHVVNSYISNPNGKHVQSCCRFDEKNAKYDPIFKAKVDFNNFCEKGNAQTKSHAFNNEDLLRQFQNIYEDKVRKHGRDIYYGAADGYSISYPARSEKDVPGCSTYDPRYQEWYRSTLSEDIGKDIVLVLDFTKNMKNLEQNMRYVVKLLLSMIDTKDRIIVKIYSLDYLHTVDATECLKGLTLATPLVTKTINQYIDARELSGVTIEYMKVAKGFESFEANKREKHLIFVTSGNYVDKESDIKEEWFGNKCRYNVNDIIILLGSSERDYYNFHKDLTERSCNSKATKGKIIEVLNEDTSTRISDKLTSIYDTFLTNVTKNEVHFTMPYGDIHGFVLMNACKKLMDNQNKMLGILCVSLFTNELAGDTSDVPENEDFYRFLTDTSGTTYVHLKYQEPTGSEKIDRHEITQFENSAEFGDIYGAITRGENGKKTFLKNVSISCSAEAFSELKNYTYYWTKAKHSQFVIGLVISSKYRNVSMNTTGLGGTELYHRMDLWNITKDYQLCRIANEVITKVSSAIKFSPDSFQRPSIYSELETKQSISNLMKYFGKKIEYLPPNSLFRGRNTREKLRESVISTNFLNKIWPFDPSYRKILGRYIGMETGMFRVYPAHLVHPYYDPRLRAWYRLAKTAKDKLVISPPYIDAFTKRVILTMSKAIYIGQGSSRQVIGVIGMDFTLSHIQLIMHNYLKGCDGNFQRVRCVLVNRNGYIIYHDHLIEKRFEDGETIQLAEIEPSITRHLIRRNLMQSQRCVQFASEMSMVEWSYYLDIKTTIDIDKENVKYTISPISGTDVVFLKIHGTNREEPYTCSKYCSSISANTSCSCLELNICEPNSSSVQAVCKGYDQRNTTFSPKWYKKDLKDLPKCYDLFCGLMRTFSSCKEQLLCHWCDRHPNGTTAYHREQYCTHAKTCFHYDKSPNTYPTAQTAEIINNKEYIIVIAILSAVIAVLLTILVIWKIKYVDRIKSPSTNLPPAVEDDEPQFIEEGGRGEINSAFQHENEEVERADVFEV